MDYITVKEVAEKWGISERRVRALCSNDQIVGAKKQGKIYLIPKEAKKPKDGRRKVINSKYIEIFDKIDELLKSVNDKRPFTQRELEKINEEFLIDFTYNSNAIEGNTLNLKETALVLEGSTIDSKPLKDHLKIAGYRDAFLYVDEIAKSSTKFDDKTINQVHALVIMSRLDNKIKYRDVSATITGTFKEMTEPSLIADSMKKMLKSNETRKKGLHAIERIVWFHLAFEGIHPYVDGNGRTGRLLMNLDLMQNGYPPINIKIKDKKRYYSAFEKYLENDDINDMVTLVCECIEERLNYYLKILNT
ncbi:MAG: Fic family protein [Clostridia bacterium]